MEGKDNEDAGYVMSDIRYRYQTTDAMVAEHYSTATINYELLTLRYAIMV